MNKEYEKTPILDWHFFAPIYFFRTGLEYYIAGRFSFFVRGISICGNLFHHAVEMIIKGHLAKTLSEPEVRSFQHRLVDLWEKFKSVTGNSQLLEFDGVVADLDKFERIRYPDKIVWEGYFARWSISEQPPIAVDAHKNMPVYEMVVDKIDKLVQAIFEHTDVNVTDLCRFYHADAIEILKRKNKFP